MNKGICRIALGSLLAFTIVNCAHAYVFSIDTFTVTRSGSPFLLDTFSDGLPPPNGPNGVNTYLMSGTMGPENVGGDGKLLLTTAGGIFSTGLLGTNPNLAQTARLDTNVNSANTTQGLKRNFAFSVIARMDLLPIGLGEQGGLRIEDRVPGVNSGRGSDIIDLRIANPAGTPVILFKETNQFLSTQITFEIPLETGHDQIDLILDHPTANTDTIFGRYEYVDGGIGQGVHSFLSTFDIFQGELFTRAVIAASGTVPEPASLALLGLGLTGLGFSRRKRA